MPKVLKSAVSYIKREETDDYLLPHIIFNSCHEVLIEGSKGVLEYNEKTVRLNAGKYILSFSGENLCIRVLNSDELIITGFIVTFDFSTV